MTNLSGRGELVRTLCMFMRVRSLVSTSTKEELKRSHRSRYDIKTPCYGHYTDIVGKLYHCGNLKGIPNYFG